MPVDTKPTEVVMCLYPKYGYRDNLNMFHFVPYSERNKIYTDLGTGEIFSVFPVKCGHCIECAEEYTREWSFRIMDEASQYEQNCFLTLTYNDEHLPEDGCLVKRDYQLFLKRFRKSVGKVRYFGCAEYGGIGLRPHYHIILFGYCPSDMYFWCKSKSGEDLYRSPTIEKLWTFGYSYVGLVSLSSARYCAKYLQKYLFDTDERMQDLVKPFTFMSTHPGIGGDYSKCLSTDKLYKAGKWVKTPRYYLKCADRDGYDLTDLKANRRFKALFFDRSLIDLVKRRKNLEKKFKKVLTNFLD